MQAEREGGMQTLSVEYYLYMYQEKGLFSDAERWTLSNIHAPMKHTITFSYLTLILYMHGQLTISACMHACMQKKSREQAYCAQATPTKLTPHIG